MTGNHGVETTFGNQATYVEARPEVASRGIDKNHLIHTGLVDGRLKLLQIIFDRASGIKGFAVHLKLHGAGRKRHPKGDHTDKYSLHTFLTG